MHGRSSAQQFVSPSVAAGRHVSARELELSACATAAQSTIAATLESTQQLSLEDCQGQLQQCSVLAMLQATALDSIDFDGRDAQGGDVFVMPPHSFKTRVSKRVESRDAA